MNDDVLRTAMAAVEMSINDPTFSKSARPLLSEGRAVLSTLPKAPSIDSVLEERVMTHGDFTDSAYTAQVLKSIMRESKNWNDMPPFMREALEQTQTKIARLLAGDFNHPDAWRDLQGYPRLVEQRL